MEEWTLEEAIAAVESCRAKYRIQGEHVVRQNSRVATLEAAGKALREAIVCPPDPGCPRTWRRIVRGTVAQYAEGPEIPCDCESCCAARAWDALF